MLPSSIVILYGGPSVEAPVSEKTAKGMAGALDQLGLSYTLLSYKHTWQADIELLNPDFVLNAMHGCPGEDGTVQAALDEMGVPYQGSGAAASALCMDKRATKEALRAAGMEILPEVVINRKIKTGPLGYPFFMKPNAGGSSLGARPVLDEKAWENVPDFDEEMICEPLVKGRELTVGIMANRALPVVEMTSINAFFDYKAKYTAGQTIYTCPADIGVSLRDRIQIMAQQAFNVLGCKGIARADFLYNTEKDHLVFLEMNTLPGMTQSSLVPKMAASEGMSYVTLVRWMIEDGLKK